jgi:hypothetical protein
MCGVNMRLAWTSQFSKCQDIELSDDESAELLLRQLTNIYRQKMSSVSSDKTLNIKYIVKLFRVSGWFVPDPPVGAFSWYRTPPN